MKQEYYLCFQFHYIMKMESKEVIAKLSFIHWLRNTHCLIILTLRYLGAKKI